MTSPIYADRIIVTREATISPGGNIGYQGLLPANEIVIASDLPASVQQVRERGDPLTDLPSDVARTQWFIFFQFPNNENLLHDRDWIYDRLNAKYIVIAAYWNLLGYKALCERVRANNG